MNFEESGAFTEGPNCLGGRVVEAMRDVVLLLTTHQQILANLRNYKQQLRMQRKKGLAVPIPQKNILIFSKQNGNAAKRKDVYFGFLLNHQQNYLLFWLFIIFQMIPPKLVLANRTTQQLYQHLLELAPLLPQQQIVYNKGARKEQRKMKSRTKKKTKVKKNEYLGNRIATPLFAKTDGWTVESSGSRDSKQRSSPFTTPRNFKMGKYFKSSKFPQEINIQDDSPSPLKQNKFRRKGNSQRNTPLSRLFTEQQLEIVQRSIQLQPIFLQSKKSIYLGNKMELISKYLVEREWIRVNDDPFSAEIALFPSKQEYQKGINRNGENFRNKQSLVNYLPINDRNIITSLFFETEGKHMPTMLELSSLSDWSSLEKIFEVGSIWMLKPRINASYNNSYIITSKQQLLQKLKALSKKNTIRQFILQRYITEISLYDRRKFTMKQIILITHINQIFKGFLCEDMIIETASLEFAVVGNNPCSHFTDHQLQRQSKLYSRYQKDNLLSSKELGEYLQKNYNFSFEDVRADMKEILVEFIKAVHSLMSKQNQKQNHFQIFEVSYILRSDGKPVLIDIISEPNLKPKHLPKLWQRCVQSILSLTLDAFIAPPASYFSRHRPQLSSRCFQMIFDSRINDYRQEGSN